MFIKLPSLIPFPHYHSCFRNIQLNQIFSLFRYLKLDFFSSGDRISHTQESITFLKLIHHLILIHLLKFWLMNYDKNFLSSLSFMLELYFHLVKNQSLIFKINYILKLQFDQLNPYVFYSEIYFLFIETNY